VHLAGENEQEGTLRLLADAVERLGDTTGALRVAKIASYKDIVLLPHAAPLLDRAQLLPAADIEGALVHGIVRQESEFDPAAVSQAGARGLMQLMPATAEQMARTLKLSYRPAKLTDPAFNIRLGSAYLEQMLERWDGSYLLAIAAYNAGPGNVRKWLLSNGDPRDPAVDPIDWIEAIPFSETRNYVQRVLESTQVYRSRLGGPGQKLGILADLRRGGMGSGLAADEAADNAASR
jgi:soluble lytic murein transglycosylase